MEKSDVPTAAPETREKESLINTALKVIAAPVAAVSAFWVAHTHVRRDAYETARRHGHFDDMTAEYAPKPRAFKADLDVGRIDSGTFLERCLENKGRYSQEINKKMEYLGLKKFSKKWQYIDRSHKQKAIIDGLTVAGIAIGAILSIEQTKLLSSLFEDKDKKR